MPPSTRAHDRSVASDDDWELESADTDSSSDEEDEEFDPTDPDTPPAKRARRNEVQTIFEYDEGERGFLETLPVENRTAYALQERAIWEDPDSLGSLVPLRFRLLESNRPKALKLLGLQKLKQLREMEAGAGEYHKLWTWLEGFVKLPLGSYRNLPIQASDPLAKTHAFLSGMMARLDEVVYGHQETKVQIVQTLARWIANPCSRGLALGIQGPPGIGKTSLVKEGVAKALGLPFASIPLGGANDVSYLDGHGFTYEGSTWGRLVDAVMHTGVMNPVLYFDEVDKVSDSARGQEIIHLLIHLTDPAQNEAFHDKYFHGVELDLSRAIIIFSYNHEEQINPILRDRLVTIRLQGYKPEQKLEIASKYLLPSVLRDYGLRPEDVRITPDVLREVLARTPEEEGVRALRRNLDTIVGNLNVLRWVPVEEQARFVTSPQFRPFALTLPFTVETHHLAYFLRPRPEPPVSHAMMYL